MKILILGGGAVGALVAKRLIRERNEVIIVEADAARCEELEDQLDAKIVQGDAASIKTLERAGLITADMLIAVTSSDQTNILGCLIAQAFSNIRIKVARLRTHEVERWRSICSSKLLGVDLVIHPDSETVERILQVIGLPGVSEIISFADGKVQLFGMRIDSQSPLIGKKIQDLAVPGEDLRFLVSMIFREGRVIIPRGEDELRRGDQIYVILPQEAMDSVFELFGLERRKKVQRVFVVGGKQLGIEAALRLEQQGVQVKLFEKDFERCQMISTLVKNTVVVHGDGTDQQLLAEENIAGIDAYLALTGEDEVNILACMLAKRMGCRKGIALVNRIDFLPMTQLLGISSTFSTRLVVVDRILQYIRKGRVVSVTTFREDEAEAIELVATSGSKYIGRRLRDVEFPRGALVGAIVRPTGEVEVPRGDSVIQLDDRVIFFCREDVVAKLERAFIY
ncbi:MAG: Trk system potassium transporter TrkA [Acidobacteriota bacterium]